MTELEVGRSSSRVTGIARRVRWRMHWALHPKRLFVVRSWWGGMTLHLPRSGAAATAYYRTFPSPAIAGWILGALGQGGIVVDVGAHAGVYALVAARCVGPTGVVHAIEPQADVLAVLEHNARANDLPSVRTHCLALGGSDGQIALQVDPRSLGAFATTDLRRGGDRVRVSSLASFVRAEQLERVDLLKLDAAGSEHDVLLGGLSVIHMIDRIVCKLYNPSVIGERFGAARDPDTTVELLRASGFRVALGDGRPADGVTLAETLAPGTYSVPVLAVRPGTARR